MQSVVPSGFLQFAVPTHEESEEIETLVQTFQAGGACLDYDCVKAGLKALGISCTKEEIRKVAELHPRTHMTKVRFRWNHPIVIRSIPLP